MWIRWIRIRSTVIFSISLPGVQVVEKLCLAGADTTASSTGENPLWIALGQYRTYVTTTGISEGPVILEKRLLLVIVCLETCRHSLKLRLTKWI
jgi:hypothetical protein